MNLTGPNAPTILLAIALTTALKSCFVIGISLFASTAGLAIIFAKKVVCTTGCPINVRTCSNVTNRWDTTCDPSYIVKSLLEINVFWLQFMGELWHCAFFISSSRLGFSPLKWFISFQGKGAPTRSNAHRVCSALFSSSLVKFFKSLLTMGQFW